MSQPALTERQIELVQQSFEAVAPQAEQLVAAFYDRLFSDFPEVQPMFQSDAKEQQKKLLGSLVMAVKSLNDLSQLQPALEQLGSRHLGYGAMPDHYKAVGATLLTTLAEFAGELWTDELEEAWTVVYTIMADTMINASETAVA